MASWPCPFQITSSPLIGYPDIAIPWHSVRFTLARIPISIPSFLWLLSSGMPSQKMFQLLQVLTHSRQQLVSCSIPSPRCIKLIFKVILFLDPSNPYFFKVNPSMKSVFMTHTFVDVDFNLSSVCRLTVVLLLFPFSQQDAQTLPKMLVRM